jgi:chromosome segregation ATPase
MFAGWAPATADDANVQRIEARLAQSRAHLHQLYSASATAAQAFDSASAQLAEADRAVAHERSVVRKTNAQLSDQSDAIAGLTVQQLQAQSGVERLTRMLHAGDPRELLAQAAAYDSTAEAMSAQVDELSARSAVHAAAQRRFEQARAAQQEAVAQLSANRATINAAIVRSQSETKAAEAERSRLLAKLAQQRQKAAEAEPARPDSHDEPAPSDDSTEHAAKPNPEPEQDDSSSDDDTSDSVWDKIAQCESGGNWHINTGNGYYGGLQFSAATWHSVGGPGLPHEHSRETQIKYAKILQKRSGWGQWSCAGARFD